MDPSIMKFLEEDEDETMHSGADVEAFTAALNRDIEGDIASTPQPPSDTDGGALSQGINPTSIQMLQQWQSSSHQGNVGYPSEGEVKAQIQEQRPSVTEVDRHGSGPESTPHEMNRPPSEPGRSQDDFQLPQADQHTHHVSQTMNIQNSEKYPGRLPEPNIAQNPDNESQLQRMRRMGNQQVVATGQAANPMNRLPGRQVPFALLLPALEPQLDKDRAMQLHDLYKQLKTNTITKEEFVRLMRTLVGDHLLKMAVYKLQRTQDAQNSENVFPNPAQHSAQHNVQNPSSYGPSSSVHQSSDSSSVAIETDAQKSRLLEHQSDSHAMQASHMSSSNHTAIKQEREQPFPLQGLGKQQQQHMHFPQSSFPAYGNTGGNYRPSVSTQSFKQQAHDLQMRQGPVHPNMGASQIGASTQAMNQMSFQERQSSFSDMKRMHGGSLPHFTSGSALQQNPGHWQQSIHKDQSLLSSMSYVKPEPIDHMNEQQYKSQLSTMQGPSSISPVQLEQGTAISGHSKDEAFEMLSSRPSFSTSKPEPMSITAQLERHNASVANSSLGAGSNTKTPPKKPSVGQKKPLEAPASSLPPSSKKPKVSGGFSDQSIEQLNDVTAVSGVNLREEEEQLFSGSKEDSRVSEASRKVVQEEEEKLILQKIPLQRKLAEIMAKSGIKNRSNDVERCLSLCVEERMRGLISNLIRLSKQRVDFEKPRHRTVVTSDVRQQIMSTNQKAREEWEKKQADAEKLQRADDPEGSGNDGDDGRGKSKVNKEEDDKMRTTAANVAARAAVGGDDMLSKWQLMAEQARQKREGGLETTSTSQPSIDVGPKPVPASEQNSKENQDMEKRSSATIVATPGSTRKMARTQNSNSPQDGIPRSISVKDVISVLERETQMSKSTLIYRLYEKVRSDTVSE